MSLDLAPVVNEILAKVDGSQMGVVLKRMMVHATSASAMAERYGIQALVPGEAPGRGLQPAADLIDNASDTLIPPPLISHDKEHIISLVCQIDRHGRIRESMPKYCGMISKSPTVRAMKIRIEQEEGQFNFAVLDAAVAQVLDIRSQDEQKGRPLTLYNVAVLTLPFYKLGSQFGDMDQRES